MKTFAKFTRDLVFGMEDGLVSHLGIVFAVWAAGSDQYTILLAGLASMFAGSLSMSAGSYLSSKSQREVYEAEISNAKKELKNKPKSINREMAKLLRKEGFDKSEVKIISKHYMQHNPNTFVQNYIQKKLHLSPERFDQPVKNAIAMFFSFSFGSIFPIFPFFFSNSLLAMIISAILTIVALFSVGVTKSSISHRNWFKSGAEMVALGLGAGILGYVIGVIFNSLI